MKKFHLMALSAIAISGIAVPNVRGNVSVPITNDTFVDSGWTPDVVGGVDEASYGADAKIKATTSDYSTSYPQPSITHVMFTLPTNFATTLATNPGAQVEVVIYPYNNSLNDGGDGGDNGYRNLELHPMLTSFTTGNGTQSPLSPSTEGGATWNSPTGIVGQTWTTNGLNNGAYVPGGTNSVSSDPGTSIAQGGGDFVDEAGANPITATNSSGDFAYANDPTGIGLKNSNSPVPFVFNITDLVQNPTLLADLETYGALIRVQNEYAPPYGTQDFTSMVSSNDTTPADAAFLPQVVFVTPEPTSLGLIGLAGTLLGARRRRR